MDTTRLANVIFDKGQKITQARYSAICESIESDIFTLDEYVIAYKLKENFLGKVPFVLRDGSKVLVSESVISKINSLNINRQELEEFMVKDYDSFKQLIEVVSNGSNQNGS